MSKASQIVVLCEDKAHEVFVTRFLTRGWGVKSRAIRVIAYPNGKGSGKQHVEDNIAQEVKACRSRQARASTILLVVRDADEDSVDEATSSLDEKSGAPRRSDESIVYIIPKWHIQTWIAYLGAVKVDESKKYNKYREISESKDAHPLIDHLSRQCRNKQELESPPDSLNLACDEFERIRKVL